MLDAAENSVQSTPYPKSNGGSLISEPLSKIGPAERKISNTGLTLKAKATTNIINLSQGQTLYKSSPHLINQKTANSYSNQQTQATTGSTKYNGPVEGICVGESFDRAIERYLLSPHNNGAAPDQNAPGSGSASVGHAIFPFMPLGMRQMQAKFMKHNKTTLNSTNNETSPSACDDNASSNFNLSATNTHSSTQSNNSNNKNYSLKRTASESHWAAQNQAAPAAKKLISGAGLAQYAPNPSNAANGNSKCYDTFQNAMQLQQQQQQQGLNPLEASYPHYLYAYYQQLYLYQQAQLAATINQAPSFWAPPGSLPKDNPNTCSAGERKINGSTLVVSASGSDSLNRMNNLISSSIYTSNNVKNMYDQLTTTTTTKSPLTPLLPNCKGNRTPNYGTSAETGDKTTTKDFRSRSALIIQAPGPGSPANFNGVGSSFITTSQHTSSSYPGQYLGTLPCSSAAAATTTIDSVQQYYNAKPKIFQNYLDSPLAAVDDHFKESLNKQSHKKVTLKEGAPPNNLKSDIKMGVRQLMYNQPQVEQQTLNQNNINNDHTFNTSLNYNSKTSKPPTSSNFNNVAEKGITGGLSKSVGKPQQQLLPINGSTGVSKPFYDLYMQYLKDMLSNSSKSGTTTFTASSTTTATTSNNNNNYGLEEPLNLITGLRGQTTAKATTLPSTGSVKTKLKTGLVQAGTESTSYQQPLALGPPLSNNRTLEQNYNLTLQTFIEQAVHVAFGYEKGSGPANPNSTQCKGEDQAQGQAQPKKLKQKWLHKHINDNSDQIQDCSNTLESQKQSSCIKDSSIIIGKRTATQALPTPKPPPLHQTNTGFQQQSPPHKINNITTIIPSVRPNNCPKPLNINPTHHLKIKPSGGATCYDFDDYSPPPIQLSSHHTSAIKNKSPNQPPSTTSSSSSQCTPPSSISGGSIGNGISMMPTEPFLQSEACNSLSPKLPKCWECRLSPSQRNQRLNIFCRFYAFRKLKINAKGTYSVAGFSETYEATSDDLKIWLPAKYDQSSLLEHQTPGFDLGSGLDLKVTCLYIFRFTLPYFVALIKQEEKALEAVSGNSKIAWKRPVDGVREMCDACQTTLFNRHWVCPKCGFAVCLDCYIGKKRWLEKSSLPPPPPPSAPSIASNNATYMALGNGSQSSNGGLLFDLKENAIKNILNPLSSNDSDDFPWLPCTNRQPHEPSKLMATHIIPNIALTEIVQVCEKLVDKYKFHNLLHAPTDNVNYQAKDNIKSEDGPLNGIRKEYTQKLNNVNGFHLCSGDRGKINNGQLLKPNSLLSRSLTTINLPAACCEEAPEISRDSVSLLDFKDQTSSCGGSSNNSYNKNQSIMAPKDRLRLDVNTTDLSTSASPLSWLADVALSTSTRTLNYCEDSNLSQTKERRDQGTTEQQKQQHEDHQQQESISFDIVDHFQNSSKVNNSFLASPKNYFKNITPSNTLDDVITAVIEQTISEPIDSDAELKNYRDYCQKSASTSCSTSSSCPSSTDSPPCDSLESLNSSKPVVNNVKSEPGCPLVKEENGVCEDVPHSWLCGGRVLHLQHKHQSTGNLTNKELNQTSPLSLPYRGKLLAKFCETWNSGAPVLVSGIHKSLDSSLWNPEWFSRAFGQFEHDFINCRRNTCIKNLKMKGFWEGFTHYHKRMKDELSNNEPMILKLKDWPSSDDFSEILPKHYKDLSEALPLPEYTQRAGLFNLASRLPQAFVKPDLGPKMYNAYGSVLHPSEGSTNLHVDISDATNILAYVGIPLDEPGQDYYFEWDEQTPSFSHSTSEVKTEAQSPGSRKPKLFSRSIWQAIKEADTDADTLDRLKRGTEVPGAIWHIYKATDAPKIRQFLITLALETGKDVMAYHDPIHDQEAYITYEMNQRLRREYNVVPYTIIQCLGDAIFIPAGAPHQVRNLYSCIKIAEDFVSPEHVGHCLKLTEEFRKLSDTHTNHEDKLQIKNIIYHTVKDVCAILNGETINVPTT